MAREDLGAYAVAVWPGFELAEHHRLVVDRLEAIESGRLKRLVVVLPPRHGKSLLCSQVFPAWYLGRNSTKSVITATYGQDLSDDFGRLVRNIVGDGIHQAIFPDCQLASDSDSMRRFHLTKGGGYFSAGRGGPVGGRGCDLLICDDLLKDADEARSETIRRSLITWYQSVARTRLTADGCIVLIGTRWHERDLIGHVLAESSEEGWVVLNFPAVAETDEGFRQVGGPLWPERFSLAVLQGIRSAIGSRAWTCLYQGKPAAAEGVLFRREWFQTYAARPEKFEQVIQSWDCAFKSGSGNDFSVCQSWATTASGYYLLSLWRGKVEFPELKRQVATQAEAWKPSAVLVEDAASGQSLVQELKLATRFPVIPVKADRSKELRAEAITPLFEAGRVFVPEAAEWLQDYLDELASFPSGVHDDMVDSTS